MHAKVLFVCVVVGFHLDNVFKAKRVAFRENYWNTWDLGFRNHQIWQGLCMFLSASNNSNQVLNHCANQCFLRWNGDAPLGILQNVCSGFCSEHLFKAEMVAFRVNSMQTGEADVGNHKIWQGICMLFTYVFFHHPCYRNAESLRKPMVFIWFCGTGKAFPGAPCRFPKPDSIWTTFLKHKL